jgi:hypothetical protein
MPIKMYDLMWRELYQDLKDHLEHCKSVYGPAASDMMSVRTAHTFLEVMENNEEKHTYISQPEAIEKFQTSKKTLAHLRDDWGMPYVTRGVGQTQQFFYKEEEVRTHLEELRGKK